MDKHPQSDEARMTRQQYRQQAANAQDGLVHRYPKSGEPGIESRTAQKIESEQLTSEEKMNRLKRRLNIVIVSLVVAIVIVYLILFLVR